MASSAEGTTGEHISDNLCPGSVFSVVLLIAQGRGGVRKFVDVHNEWPPPPAFRMRNPAAWKFVNDAEMKKRRKDLAAKLAKLTACFTDYWWSRGGSNP